MFVAFQCSHGQFYELVGRFQMGAPLSVEKSYHGESEFHSSTWRMGYRHGWAFFDGPEMFVRMLDALGYEPTDLPF